jgi:hypothetical protein
LSFPAYDNRCISATHVQNTSEHISKIHHIRTYFQDPSQHSKNPSNPQQIKARTCSNNCWNKKIKVLTKCKFAHAHLERFFFFFNIFYFYTFHTRTEREKITHNFIYLINLHINSHLCQLSSPISDFQILHLNAALQWHVLPKISAKMIMQRGLINPLMMIALANIVKHALHQQPHQINDHQHPNQEPTHHNPHKNPILAPSVHHHRAKHAPNDHTNRQIYENKHPRVTDLSLEQLVALFHGGETVYRFQHRHHAGQVPHRGYIDMNNKKEQEDDHHGHEQQKGVLGVNGYDQ